MRDENDPRDVAVTESSTRPGSPVGEEEVPTILDKPNGAMYELSIPARIEAVGPLCAFLNTIGECHGLTEVDLQALEISAYETSLNIIEHAYGFDPEARILIRISLGLRRACIAFIDRGTGINPDMIPPPDLRDPNVRRRGRGFGLQIIRKSVNRMRYRRLPSGENRFFIMRELARDSYRDAGLFAMRGGDLT